MRSRMHIAATLPLAIVLIPTFWFAACSSSVLAGFTYGVLKSISVTPSSVTLTKGSSQQFVATGTYSSGATLNLTKSVIWSSSNTTVGTISKSGLAAAKGAGSATIKATFGRYTGSAILNVTGATSAVPRLYLRHAGIDRTYLWRHAAVCSYGYLQRRLDEEPDQFGGVEFEQPICGYHFQLRSRHCQEAREPRQFEPLPARSRARRHWRWRAQR